MERFSGFPSWTVPTHVSFIGYQQATRYLAIPIVLLLIRIISLVPRQRNQPDPDEEELRTTKRLINILMSILSIYGYLLVPAGVTIYFLTSSVFTVLESRYLTPRYVRNIVNDLRIQLQKEKMQYMISAAQEDAFTDDQAYDPESTFPIERE